MNVNRPIIKWLWLVAALATATTFANISFAFASSGPVKETLTSKIGWEVNEAGGKVCLVAAETCLLGKVSTAPGGFEFPEGVAGAPNGDVYVTDKGNHRVEKFTDTGEFVLMFGWEVNQTKDHQGGATQAEKNVCTATSTDVCGTGVSGTGPGQFGGQPSSATVDPLTGNVYVLDLTNARIEEFTATGEFLLSITGGAEHGPLHFESLQGNLLAVGGKEDLLYVGERGRVQEFEANGSWKGEFTTPGNVKAIAVDDSCAQHIPFLTESTTPTCASFDQTFGDIYVAYQTSNSIQQFSPTGQLLSEPIEITPSHTDPQAHAEAQAGTIEIDPQGRLAVTEREAFYEGTNEHQIYFGVLYVANTGQVITDFPTPNAFGSHGITFNGNDELYAVASSEHEIFGYLPVAVAEVITGDTLCEAGADEGTDATFRCSLNGEVNPYGVPGTVVWFELGETCAFGTNTPSQQVETVETFLSVTAIENLRPNQGYCYQLVGRDQNVSSSEDLTGSQAKFATESTAPRVLGAPGVSFVKASSAVMSGELNPENALTTYRFEYGSIHALSQCPGLEEAPCPGVASTAALKSSLYGRIGATLEASGLQPETEYAYRLSAVNDHGQRDDCFEAGSVKCEATFKTPPAPAPYANTGESSGLGSTDATIHGVVYPEGQPATYSFEVGVDAGEDTEYGVVASGPVAGVPGPVEEALSLTGLQPGTRYAYRIGISSGYINSESRTVYGKPEFLTTMGLPPVLATPRVFEQLPIPLVAFPVENHKTLKCRHGYVRDKHGRCRKVKSRKPQCAKVARGCSRKGDRRLRSVSRTVTSWSAGAVSTRAP